MPFCVSNMSNRIALLTLAGLLLLATGCSNKQAPTEPDTPSPLRDDFDTTQGDIPSRDWPREVYYARALTLMDNDERMEYFRQESDTKRDLYLRSIGADARVDLHYRLKPKTGEVVDMSWLKGLFTDELWDDAPVRYHLNEVWGLKRFNGRGYTHMLITLNEGRLVDTASFSEQQWIENEQIYAECSRIENELNKILSKGMAMTAIPQQVDLFSTDVAEVFASVLNQNLERTDDSWKIKQQIVEYQMRMKPYMLIADRKNPDADMSTPIDYFALVFREPLEERFEGRRTMWRWELPFGDRAINMVFEFRDRELHAWYCEPAPRSASN